MARPRKQNIERQPNGQPQRGPERGHRQRALTWARLRDKELGTPFGMMKWAEQITERMYDAGMEYKRAREAADRALGLGPLIAKGQDISAVGGHDTGEETPEQIKRKRNAIRKLEEMERIMVPGSKCLAAVQFVVLYEQNPIDYQQVLDMKSGLRKLVDAKTATGRRT